MQDGVGQVVVQPSWELFDPTHLHHLFTQWFNTQEKKERRALKKLEGDEDDIDALLAQWVICPRPPVLGSVS